MPTLWVLIWLESIKQACIWTYDRIFQQLLLGFNKNVKNNATGYFSHSDKKNTETVIITIFSVNVRMLRSTLDLIVKCFFLLITIAAQSWLLLWYLTTSLHLFPWQPFKVRHNQLLPSSSEKMLSTRCIILIWTD